MPGCRDFFNKHFRKSENDKKKFKKTHRQPKPEILSSEDSQPATERDAPTESHLTSVSTVIEISNEEHPVSQTATEKDIEIDSHPTDAGAMAENNEEFRITIHNQIWHEAYANLKQDKTAQST